MKKINKDQWLALFYCALGIFLIVIASKIRYLFSVDEADIGPKAFPTMIGVGLILCSIGKFISSIGKESKTYMKDHKGWLRIAVIVLVLIVYISAIKYLGYLLSSFIATIVLTYMLGEGRDLKFWKVVLFSAILTVVIYFLFQYVIKVILPAGKWMKKLLKALR